MNLDGLKATIAKNKTGLKVAGAAAVGGLALMQARKGAGGKSDPAGAVYPGSASSAGSPIYTSPQGFSAGGAYDSSASDVYNAIVPQLENLTRLYENAKPPVPTPAPPVSDGFYARAGSNVSKGAAIFRVHNGQLETIKNATSFRQLGGSTKNIRYVTENEPIWALPKATPPTPVPK